MKPSPSGGEADAARKRRKLEYQRQVRMAGAAGEAIGYVLLLIGLAIALFGRYLPGGGGILPWLGLGFLFPALACFLLSIVNRIRWKRNHPFNG